VRVGQAIAIRTGVLFASLSLARVSAAQPSLGQKLPGTAGLDAGSQPEPGVYAAYRFAYYDSIHVRDEHGTVLPLGGLHIDALANVFGLGATVRLGRRLHLGATFAVPIARVTVTTDEPRATVDQFGFGDVFVEPLKIGGVWRRLDLVASYAFYAPTRQINRHGIGAPQWAHQLSAGGTVYFDRDERARLSALLGYNLYQRKHGIEITRGDSLQIQGGIGAAVHDVVEIGVAGYALWQLRDDRGRDLPPVLSGRRERAYGVGPELNVFVPKLRAKLGIRYIRDLGVRGRLEGQLVVVGASFRLWVMRGSACR
jgi:hypothetical protein